MTHKHVPLKIGVFILIIFAVCVCLTALLREWPAEIINTNTVGNTKYVVSRKFIFGNDVMSHINPFSVKDHYTVEVQKAKTDKNGIKVWKYDKTVDYGTHKPNIAN